AALGHSLGAAAALSAADALSLTRVVLLAPFTSMTDMARRTVGWPLCYINRHRFDNLARLAALASRGARVHVFHGALDEVIPVALGFALLSPIALGDQAAVLAALKRSSEEKKSASRSADGAFYFKWLQSSIGAYDKAYFKLSELPRNKKMLGLALIKNSPAG